MPSLSLMAWSILRRYEAGRAALAALKKSRYHRRRRFGTFERSIFSSALASLSQGSSLSSSSYGLKSILT